jgi:hypothetical protein
MAFIAYAGARSTTDAFFGGVGELGVLAVLVVLADEHDR